MSEIEAAEAVAEPETSLSEHEAQFGSTGGERPTSIEPDEPVIKPKAADTSAAPAEPAADGLERDEKGQFKPRHRAKSQQASPDDVPRIAELTKRLREAERERDELRTRATPAAEPAKTEPPVPERFPKFDQWLASNEGKDFDDWLEARDDYRDQQREAREAQRSEQQAQREALKGYAEKIPAAQAKYPDFEDVLASAPPVSRAIERAVLAVGPEAAYYLATHPDECAELTEETLVAPNAPGFAAVVASTKRYLATLVAGEQRSTSSPSRAAAAPTGSALALVSSPTPKPPNPVRTGAMRGSGAVPDDDASLAEHEKAFYKSRRA